MTNSVRLVAVTSLVFICLVALLFNWPSKSDTHSPPPSSEVKEIKAIISELRDQFQSSADQLRVQSPPPSSEVKEIKAIISELRDQCQSSAEQLRVQKECPVCEECKERDSDADELRGRIEELTRKNAELQRKVKMAKTDWNECLRMKFRTNCTDYRREDPNQIPCQVEILYDLVVAADEALTHGDIVHWAAFGTLLGAKRNNAIIPWTSDSDFLYTTERIRGGRPIFDDVIKVSREELYDRGFLIFHHTLDANQDFGKVCIAKHNEKYKQFSEETYNYYQKHYPYLDLFSGVFGDSYFHANMFGCNFTRDSVLPLGKIRLYDHEITAPKDPHRYLIQNFGPDYMTPPAKKDGHGSNECHPDWKALI